MQIGSEVECIKGFEDTPVGFILGIICGLPIPIKGNKYYVEGIKRCNCGEHDNLKLKYLDSWWHKDHFRELEKIPAMNVDEVLKKIFEHEENLETVH